MQYGVKASVWVMVLSQGEVFIPLQLEMSAAFARFFGFTGQTIGSHLHKGAESRVAVWQLGRLRLRWNHCAHTEKHTQRQSAMKEYKRGSKDVLCGHLFRTKLWSCALPHGQEQRSSLTYTHTVVLTVGCYSTAKLSIALCLCVWGQKNGDDENNI